MSKQLTVEDAKQSLESHVAQKGEEIREKFGPHIGWSALMQILDDRTVVRYPVEIVFDASALGEGEFAHPLPLGNKPEDGFKMHVHPYFATQPDRVPSLVLYQLVLVNYGEFASANDAETFGSCALGISKDEYYNTLCTVVDEISGSAAA
ncbi:MAG: hypothetical protein H0X66_00920 [Verrucomicrobia bacterium]|nr:hypothetical protein [Verrucomicrobiota bacterium]